MDLEPFLRRAVGAAANPLGAAAGASDADILGQLAGEMLDRELAARNSELEDCDQVGTSCCCCCCCCAPGDHHPARATAS